MKIVYVTIPLPGERGTNTTAPIVRQMDSVRAAGHDIDIVEVAGPPKLKFPATLPRVRSAVRDADVVHGHYGYCGWLARAQNRVPTVVSFMGSDLLGTPDVDGRLVPASRLEMASSRRLAPLVDAVIVKSDEMARELEPLDVHVIPNGVDLDTFRPVPRSQARGALGWPTGGWRVLFAGNPENPRKGHRLAVEAVDAASAELETKIELVALDGIDPGLVPTYMSACDAMLMTSLIEGSPNVVKEAMACDLPVVSVPVGDVDFLLEGVGDARLVSRSAQQLAVALQDVLRSDSPPEGRAAIKRKSLDLDSVANKLIQLYEHVSGRAQCEHSLPA